jgi:archaellin
MQINKKALMGIGMLIVFMATVVISGMAAGVLIGATGVLQERALKVEEVTRARIVSGVETFSIFGNGNVSTETISEFEFHIWPRAASMPIQMKSMGFAFITDSYSLSPILNETITGEACEFENLITDREYCIFPRIGNNNTVLEEGEIFVLKFKLSDERELSPEADITIIFQPKAGGREIMNIRTPEMVLTNKIQLR